MKGLSGVWEKQECDVCLHIQDGVFFPDYCNCVVIFKHRKQYTMHLNNLFLNFDLSTIKDQNILWSSYFVGFCKKTLISELLCIHLNWKTIFGCVDLALLLFRNSDTRFGSHSEFGFKSSKLLAPKGITTVKDIH